MTQWLIVRECHFELHLWLFPPTMESQKSQSASHKALIYFRKSSAMSDFPLASWAENEVHHICEMRFLCFLSRLFADFGEIGFKCRGVIFKQKAYLPEYCLEVKDRPLAWFVEQALVWRAVLLQKRGKKSISS